MKRYFFAVLLTVALTFSLSACVMADIDDDEFYLPVGDVRLFPGEDVEEIIGYLGSYNEIYRSSSCGFDGEDKIYRYDGFDLYTVADDGKEIIDKIVLKSDEVCTERGIRVGDTRAKVMSEYGRGVSTLGENLKYENDGRILEFLIRDGIVTAIRYLADQG